MYPSHLPPGPLPPRMVGDHQLVFLSGGSAGPFVQCQPSPNPYGPSIGYGMQYSGMPQPGPQIINCPIPFGVPSPPHWQHMGPVPPMFGMPSPRQPMPYQSAYIAPNQPLPPPAPMYMNNSLLPPQPYGQPFRPPQFSAGQAPYMMTTYPGDDVFFMHQDGIPVAGGYGFPPVPVRATMQPQCYPPPQYNQGGVSFISQQHPNMHGMQRQPLIQFSGMQPVGYQQTQHNTYNQQHYVPERVHYKKAEWEGVSVSTSHVNQSYKPPSSTNSASSLKKQATQLPEQEDGQSATVPPTIYSSAPTGVDDSVDKSRASDITPSIPEKPPEEEEDSIPDVEIEDDQPGSDLLESSDEMLDTFDFSSSQTTLIMSPSSSDGSLTLRSSPVSSNLSDDISNSDTDDNIPTKDHEYALSPSHAECGKDDNTAHKKLNDEPLRCGTDNVTRPETGVSKKETQQGGKDSQQCDVLSGRVAPHMSCNTSGNKERHHCSSPSAGTEGKPSCSQRKSEKVDKGGISKQASTATVHQKPCKIRSHIDRPVYQEKPSRVLTAQQVHHPSSPGNEQGSDKHAQDVKPSYLTSHFRLLFEPIPQLPKKEERCKAAEEH